MEIEFCKTTSINKRNLLTVLKSFILSGKYTFTSEDIVIEGNGTISKKEVHNNIQRIIDSGIIERLNIRDSKRYFRFKTAASPKHIFKNNHLYTKDEICSIMLELTSRTSLNGKKVAEILLKFLNDGIYSFTGKDIRINIDLSSSELHHLLRKYIKSGVLDRNGKILSFSIKPDSLENDYSPDIINLIEELINSDKSSKKDKRIGSVIYSCLSKGVITAEDYERIGETTKMSTDMAFAKQLGLVELLPDGNYEINKALKNSFNKIEKGTKNILSEMYSIFGDGLFSAEMVIAELNYSHSHTNATLHKLTWLKVLNCTIDEEKRYHRWS